PLLLQLDGYLVEIGLEPVELATLSDQVLHGALAADRRRGQELGRGQQLVEGGGGEDDAGCRGAALHVDLDGLLLDESLDLGALGVGALCGLLDPVLLPLETLYVGEDQVVRRGGL